MWVYIKVTKDKYEFIEAIADSVEELAEQCETTEDVIFSALPHKNNQFKRVWIDEE